MNERQQKLFESLDKTTVDGLAEALLIAIGSLTNEDGMLYGLSLSPFPSENIRLAREIAKAVLGVKE